MIRNRVGLISTAAITLGASVVWFASLEAALEYRVDWISRGDWWRVATCHLAHWSPEQLLWDGATMLILGAVFDRVAVGERHRLFFAIFGSAVAIPLALAAFQPRLEIYRGLSGIDSALFVLVGFIAMRKGSRRLEQAVIAFAIIGFVAKIVVEVTTGSALFVQDLGAGVAAVPLAHATGAAVGLLAAMKWKGHARARLELATDLNGGEDR